MRYLGIDFGTKKIGLAFGDADTKLAMPAEVVKVQEEDPMVYLARLVKEEDIDEIVVGVPLSVGAHSTDQLETTRAFIRDLREQVSVPVHEVDEKYTSVESQRLQQEYGSDVPEDALAAMLILEQYFHQD